MPLKRNESAIKDCYFTLHCTRVRLYDFGMKRKIMIVEDNAEISEMLTLFLTQDGFETCSFPTAEDALSH